MDNKRKLELAKELFKRKKKEQYKSDFELFAKEQIRIITKNASQGFVPFTFNAAQVEINKQLEAQLAKTGKVRAIVLKARQQGISTYCAARVFWKTYFTPYTRSVVMAHDSATSDALFNMSRNIIDNMEEPPTLQKSNAKEILFEHNKSGYRLYTAGAKEAGRGTTPTIAHLSEVAFWQFDEQILAGLFQGISQENETEVILESTANGASGEFFRLFQGAINGDNEYVPIFLPWYITPEYRRKAPEGFELTEEEEELVENYSLDNDQLYWRRLKIGESGEKKFIQEYPASAEEAFLVTGNSVFDQEIVQMYEVKAPDYTRAFDYESSYFEDNKSGHLEMWKAPKFEDRFIIGADVSLGVGQDYSTAVILNKEREVCALFRDNYIDPSVFGDILFYLGRYFNNALLAVESNSLGIATLNRLKQMNYVNLYYQTKAATLLNDEGSKPGFRTTISTKPMIIGNLKRAIEEHDIEIHSDIIVSELRTYVSAENGSTNALAGNYDDTVMALAIAFEAYRTHQHRLTNDLVSWKDKIGTIQEDTTTWL
ncbi:hypothetical protein N9M66_04385 [Litoreibacter sp.]|nr:hypothetical protein [Litoreibacter sp.]